MNIFAAKKDGYDVDYFPFVFLLYVSSIALSATFLAIHSFIRRKIICAMDEKISCYAILSSSLVVY